MYRVFLIDDEPWAMVSLEHLIDWQSLGFEIAGKIDNARTAWEQIQREKPDVIITDIRMPGLSGLELLSLVRESALPIEVVLVSAFADFTYAQEAISKGAAEYLLKPVRRDKLTACIQQLADNLAKRSMQRDREAAVSRREILVHAAYPWDAYTALGGQADAGDVLVMHCCTEMDALLRKLPQAAAWPRIPLEAGVTIYLCACSDQGEALFDQLCALCRAHGLHGGFGMARACCGNTRMETLLWLSRNARYTALFIAQPGLLVSPDLPEYAQEMELFKALQYNQNTIVHACLESLRQEVESGRLLLDKLTALLHNMDSFYRHVQNNPSLFPAEWKQYSDLLRDYPTIDALFAHLNAAFSDDHDEALLTPVLQEIENRYACNRTLSDLGQELGVSQAYLSQLIRRRTGKTYSELVQEKRMEKAKELLAYSETAVMDIAVEVGYSDQFYFSKLFKRLWGLSPAAWRKKVRSGDEITKKEMK